MTQKSRSPLPGTPTGVADLSAGIVAILYFSQQRSQRACSRSVIEIETLKNNRIRRCIVKKAGAELQIPSCFAFDDVITASAIRVWNKTCCNRSSPHLDNTAIIYKPT
ncbi:MAG: hypothetical protein ACR65R_09265 [Methylomicrobium sp.]